MIKTLIIGLFGLALIAGTRMQTQFRPSQERHLIAPVPLLRHLHFGFNEIISDMLWVRAIQDFDFCEKKVEQGTCKGNGWLYQMLESISALSPHFRVPAVAGGVALSVLVADIAGATKYFDISVQNFPRDWQVNYYAAYHAIYEEKNKEKAAGLLLVAAKHGGPDWLPVLAVRLFTDAGKRDLGLGVYESLKNSNFEPGFLKRMREKLGLPETK